MVQRGKVLPEKYPLLHRNLNVFLPFFFVVARNKCNTTRLACSDETTESCDPTPQFPSAHCFAFTALQLLL